MSKRMGQTIDRAIFTPKRFRGSQMAGSQAKKKRSYKNYRPSPGVLAKQVRKIIEDTRETKVATDGNSITLFAATSLVVPYQIAAIPGISQGTISGWRIGSEIRVRSVKFNYSLHPNPSENGALPCEVMIVVAKYKADTAGTTVAVADYNNLILRDTGNAGGIYTAERESSLAPINLNTYDVLCTRRHKVGYSTLSGNTTNNDFHLLHTGSIDVTRFIKKSLHYDENVSAVNNTDNCILFFIPLDVDGTVSSFPVLDFQRVIEFTDA